jgi:hypothetical protein
MFQQFYGMEDIFVLFGFSKYSYILEIKLVYFTCKNLIHNVFSMKQFNLTFHVK